MKFCLSIIHISLYGLILFFIAAPTLGQELTVLQIAPFGGNLATAARDYNLGALLAVDEANELGGIRGKKLRLISRDDGNDAKNTLSQAIELIKTESPSAIIGVWGDASVDALLNNPVFKNSSMPIVGVRSGSTALRNQQQLFLVRSSYHDEVDGMQKQISVMGLNKVAIVYEDNLFGSDTFTYAEGLFKKENISILKSMKHNPSNLDFSTAVKDLIKAGPQAILIFSNTNAAAALVKGLREKMHPAFIIATSTVEASVLTTQLGPKIASGVAIAQSVPNPQKSSIVAMRLRNKMVSLNISPQRANFSSLEGYIAMRTVIEAMNRSDKGFKPQQLTSSLETMQRVDFGGFYIDFSPVKHDGSKFVELSIISEDGKLRQ